MGGGKSICLPPTSDIGGQVTPSLRRAPTPLGRDEQNQHYHIQREVEFKFKKCFLFQMQQLSNDCVWMLINTQNRQKWSWTVHN